MQVEIEIEGLNKLLKKCNNIVNIDSSLLEVYSQSASLVQGQAKALAPTDTGQLRNSILKEVKNKSAKVFTNVGYAPYVEFGTGSVGNGTYPYEIKGKKLKYRSNSWVYRYWEDGDLRFRRTNGQVAQPYMYPALEMNKTEILQMFDEKIKEVLNGGN